MSSGVLVVDDDPQVRGMIELAFPPPDWEVTSVPDAEAALEVFAGGAFEIVLLDLQLPTISGLAVLQILRERDPNIPVIMFSGHGGVASAVEAMQLGADNFLEKPFDLRHLEALMRRAIEKADLRRRTEYLLRRRQLDARAFAELGDTPVMREVAQRVEVLAPVEATVLLQGETGTGKGRLAELMHSLSPRAEGPFVEINCAGLSATFLDSELFGHEKGAFTDAKAPKRGLFEVAHGGTLFLDEIGDLASELQPKLLKVLETRRFRRLGATREISVDVRVITATNRDLRERIRSGDFREDLYYRVAPHVITLPPLRERGDEAIADLAHHLLAAVRRELGRGPREFSAEALQYLLHYSWPGNVRELRSVLEHAALNSGDAHVLVPAMLPAELRGGFAPASAEGMTPAASDAQVPLATFLAQAERGFIAETIRRARGNRAKAARMLGISRATLYEKLRRHGLSSGTEVSGQPDIM